MADVMWYWHSHKTTRILIIVSGAFIFCARLASVAPGHAGTPHLPTAVQGVRAGNVETFPFDRLDLSPYDELLVRAALKLEEWKYFEALDLAVRAIEWQPEKPFGYALRATIFARMGRVPEAIQDLTRAIELDPKTGEHYRRRGAGYIKTGDYQTAIRDLTMAIKLGENDLTIFLDRGYAFEQLGRYSQAIREYSEALNISPSDYLGLRSRGWVYRCLGEYQKAIRDFDKILEGKPLDKEAWLQRSSAYIEAEQFEAALKDIDFIVEQGYQDGQVYLDLAFIHFQRNDIEKALLANAKALKSDEQDTQVLAMFQKGLLFLKQGNPEKGKQVYLKGLERARDLERFLSLDDSLMELTSLRPTDARVAEIKREILQALTQVKQDLRSQFSPPSDVCKQSVG